MRERLIALRERRAILIERARVEREGLASLLARTDVVTSWFDAGASTLAGIRDRPLWVLGALALLVAVRPRRALRWAASGWSLWRSYRMLHRWWRRIGPTMSTHPVA